MSESPTLHHDDTDLTKTADHGDAGDKPSKELGDPGSNPKGWESTRYRELRYSESDLALLMPLFQEYRNARETALNQLILQLANVIRGLADDEAKREVIRLLEQKLQETKAQG